MSLVIKVKLWVSTNKYYIAKTLTKIKVLILLSQLVRPSRCSLAHFPSLLPPAASIPIGTAGTSIRYSHALLFLSSLSFVCFYGEYTGGSSVLLSATPLMLQLQSPNPPSTLPVVALCEVILTSFQPFNFRSEISQSPCNLVNRLCHAPLKSTSSSLCSSDLDPLTKPVVWSQLDRSSVLTPELYKTSTRHRVPTIVPHVSRSFSNPPLSSRSLILVRFMKSVVRRLQLEHNRTKTLCCCKESLRTLPLDLVRVPTYYYMNSSRSGIMILALWSHGYRYLLNLSPLVQLFSDLQQVSSCYTRSETRSSRTIGIMTFYPWRGGYRSVPILHYATSVCHESCQLHCTNVWKSVPFCQSLENLGNMTIASRSVVTDSSPSMTLPNLIPQSFSLPLSRSNHLVSRQWKPLQRPNVTAIRTIQHITTASANVASDLPEFACGLVLLCSSLQHLWFMNTDLSICTFNASICY